MSMSESKSNRLSDVEKVLTYQITLKSMERLLDQTDRRQFTSSRISEIAESLREIIIGFSDMREQPVRFHLLSLEGVLASLRRAQNELSVAADMLEARSKLTESNRRSFYKCLNNFQEYLFEALGYFQ